MSQQKIEEMKDPNPEPKPNPPEEMKEPKKNKLARCCKYLYNKKTGEVLGRDKGSWARITLFYIIFFIFLFTFFFMLLFLMLSFMSASEPYHKAATQGTLLSSAPVGLNIVPNSGDVGSSYIHFSAKNVARMSDQMKKLIADGHVNRDPGPCTESDNFGYKNGKPCFAVRVNKLIGWTPKPLFKDVADLDNGILSEDIIANIKDYLSKLPSATLPSGLTPDKLKAKLLSSVWIQCKGATERDIATMGDVTYYPWAGIPTNDEGYFPYPGKKKANYKSPFVMIKFNNPLPNIPISVNCKVMSGDKTEKDKKGKGGAQFQFMVEQ